jgi:serine-type D-Ala-D-Ala carboxypeptidase/endopeptidase
MWTRWPLPLVALACACGRVPVAAPEPAPSVRPVDHTAAVEEERIVEIARSFQAIGDRRGIGVAVLDGADVRYHGAGHRVDASSPAPDADTVFEIGSLSKVFVGYLLADALERRELALDDPAADYVPFAVPSKDGEPIRLVHLATLTSGLPFFPDNWIGQSPDNRVQYTSELFAKFLASYSLSAKPGTRYLYGNTGTGLLAIALTERAHRTFPALLRERVFTPFGMTRSSYPDGSPPPDDNVSVGHDEDEVAMPWRIATSPIGPCCAVRSTLRDMATFGHAVLEPTAGDAAAMTELIAPRAATTPEGAEHYGLGIRVRNDGVLWKDGQVSGHRSVIALVPREHRGIVVFVNSYKVDIIALAFRLLDAVKPRG